LESSVAIDLGQFNGACSAPGPAAASSPAAVTFHEVLSALNPLQYVPVVGNIYRALTGDSPPEPVRIVGSLIFSGLTGGPLGMALNMAVTAAQKMSGIDLDHVAHELMASVGLVAEDTAAPADATQTRIASAAYARTMDMDWQAIGHG